MIVVTDTGTGMSPDLITRHLRPILHDKGTWQRHRPRSLHRADDRPQPRGIHQRIQRAKPGNEIFNLSSVDRTDGRGGKSADASQYPVGRGELILVVDDEASIREIATATLEKFNYRVLTATDGSDAVGVFAQHRGEIAAIVTDMSMPFLDGPGMIRAIRRIDPTVKVIAMSGLMNPEHTAELEALNISAFLAKPFTAEELLTKLSAALHEA